MEQTVEGQVSQGFNWKQVASGLASSIPHIFAALNNRAQAVPVGAISANPGVSSPVVQVMESGQNAIATTKRWLGPHPVLRVGGVYLMADGVVAIIKDEFLYSMAVAKGSKATINRKKHLWRLARIGLGYYMIRMK
jgi:hypothetical protein